jgi:hypothetical protein
LSSNIVGSQKQRKERKQCLSLQTEQEMMRTVQGVASSGLLIAGSYSTFYDFQATNNILKFLVGNFLIHCKMDSLLVSAEKNLSF